MNKNTLTIHEHKAFKAMHRSGKLAADVLDYITPFVKPGVTTIELNDLAHNFIINHIYIYRLLITPEHYYRKLSQQIIHTIINQY